MVERALTLFNLPDYSVASEFESPSPDIVYFPNPRRPRAMDLILEGGGKEQRYEETCFEFLRDIYPNVFLLGPHYIDWVFGKSKLAGEARMDAMGLVPHGDGLTLRGFSEFKSGKANGIVRKMQGISNTLDILRAKPTLLQDVLNSFGANITFPRIYIPDDLNIDVKFISPTPKQAIYDPLPFKVDFVVVPSLEKVTFLSKHIELPA